MSFVDRTVLITGGAGFIGCNLARRVVADGGRVILLDDLSRNGVDDNLARLRADVGAADLEVHLGDVRNPRLVRDALVGVDAVFHFAAQVAVTSSVADPVHDFEVNVRGTINLLEELRRLAVPPPLLYTSTNKVYGDLADVELARSDDRYEPIQLAVRDHGIGEDRPLSFCSPYGCSKGAADQYVLDYATSFGLPTVVFRMSCIYGPHQRGNEDQGWLAHFLLQAAAERPISIYGDGGQVRDALFVDDLVDAMDLALANIDIVGGQAFNMGGGPQNTTSLLELLDLIRALDQRTPIVRFDDWRIGDQRWFVSDTRRFEEATGWRARVGVAEGVTRLHDWLKRDALDRSWEAAV